MPINFNVNGIAYQVDNDSAVVMRYPNDMLDGLYVDIDEHRMLFVPKYYQDGDRVVASAVDMGIPEVLVPEGVDLDDEPHCYVVSSLAQIVIQSAEELLEG